MNNNLYPNSFQVHNFYIDSLLHLLDGNEFKILVYTIRRIVGFNKDNHQDHISLSQYQNGLRSRSTGNPLDNGTGLSKEKIISCLQELKKYKIIEEVESTLARGVKCYQLQLDGSLLDLAGLQKRLEQKKVISCQRTLKARETQQNKADIFIPSQSDRPVSQTDQSVRQTSQSDRPVKSLPLVSGTDRSLVSGTDTQNSEETQKEKNIHVLLAQDVCVEAKLQASDSEKDTVKESTVPLEPEQQTFLNQQSEDQEKQVKPPTTKKRSKTNTFTCAPIWKEKVDHIFAFWKKELNHPTSLLLPERGRAVVARLEQGYTVEQIEQAILGCKMSPHNQGLTNGVKYDDLELICRSGSKLEHKIGIYLQNKPKAKPSVVEKPVVEKPVEQKAALQRSEESPEESRNFASYLQEARNQITSKKQ